MYIANTGSGGGNYTVIDSNQQQPMPQGSNVFMQWQDTDGAVSPIYKAQVHANGAYSFNLNTQTDGTTPDYGWIDATGKKHTFAPGLLAGNAQLYRIWVPMQKLPDGNELLMFRSVGGFFAGGWWSSEDSRQGQVTLTGVNVHDTAIFMYEWPEGVQDGASYMTKPRADWKISDPSSTGLPISGSVWRETSNAMGGGGLGPLFNGKDVGLAGYQVVGSTLTKDGIAAYQKTVESAPTADQPALAKQLLMEHPEYIAETVVTTVGDDGSFKLKFTDAVPTGISNNQSRYLYLEVLDPKGVIQTAYSSYTAPLFRAPDKANFAQTAPIRGLDGGWVFVNMAVVPHTLANIDITNYGVTDGRQAPYGGTADVKLTGDPLSLIGNNKVVWTASNDPNFTLTVPVADISDGSMANLTISADGSKVTTQDGQSYTFKEPIPMGTTFVATLTGGDNAPLSKDSFMVAPSYPETAIVTGQEKKVAINNPSKPDAKLDDPYKLGTDPAGQGAPDFVTIDPKTGELTVKPTDQTMTGVYEVPVDITYNNGGTGQITAEVTVLKPKPMVTDPKTLPASPADGIDGLNNLPTGTTVKWTDQAQGVIDAAQPGKPVEVPATVTIPGQGDVPVKIPVTINQQTPAPMAKPEGITTPVGVEPEAKSGIANTDKLPKDATYSWKTNPDVSTPGDITGTVVVTYDDHSQDEVPVTIHVQAKTTEADTNQPVGQDVTTTVGTEPSAKDAIKNVGDLPKDATYTWRAKPDVAAPGDVPGIVVVTYGDHSQDKVPVTIHVQPAPTQTPAPMAKPDGIDTKVGVVPDPKSGIANADKLPEGTTYTWKEQPDVSNPGQVDGTVVVTINGKSTDVPVKINVQPAPNPTPTPDNQTYEAKGGTLDQPYGTKTTDQEVINSVKVTPNPPANTQVTIDPDQSLPDGMTPGDYPIKVTVTYPDGTKDQATVTVKVGEKPAPNPSPAPGKLDWEQYQPTVTPITTDPGKLPAATQGITNGPDSGAKDKLPAGTGIDWSNPAEAQRMIDQAQPGTTVNIQATVKYPDGTTDQVMIPVTINQPQAGKTDADNYTPVTQPMMTDPGMLPSNPADGIKNLGDLPGGTQVAWKNPTDAQKMIDSAQPGTTVEIPATVTYPDGSTDSVTIPVTIKAPAKGTDADNHQPLPQPIPTQPGALPNATDGVKNLGDLPGGTKVAWTNPTDAQKMIDQAKPGTTVEIPATVTYPDGSTDSVMIPIMVKPVMGGTMTETKGQSGAGAMMPGTSGTIANAMMATPKPTMTSKAPAQRLPQTGDQHQTGAALAGLALTTALLGLFGLKGKQEN